MTNILMKRGPTNKVVAYTGSVGELVVDTTKKTVLVQDGKTAGGIVLAKYSDIPDTSALVTKAELTLSSHRAIPNTGDRDSLNGYEHWESFGIVDKTAYDSLYSSLGNVLVKDSDAQISWTKVVAMAAGSVTLGSKWSWSGGSAPTLKFPGVLVCHWHGAINHGIASYIAGA